MILNCLAMLILSLPAVGEANAAGYKVRAIAQIPNGAATVAGSPQLNLSAYLAPGERLVMSRVMEVDEARTVYLNFDRISRTRWKELSVEEAFRESAGREPDSAEELAGWRTYFEKKRPQTDTAKEEAWAKYREGSSRIHPGFSPLEARRPLSVKIDTSGKVLAIAEKPVSPAQTGLIDGTPISEEDLAWFQNNVQLTELAHMREKVEWRESGKKKSAERRARFDRGLKLGEDKAGNTVFFMEIVTPFLRPHTHGTSDYLARVYVLDKQRRILQVESAYPSIRMHAATHDLYELYQGPYEGLMPALDDPKVRPLLIRIWSRP